MAVSRSHSLSSCLNHFLSSLQFVWSVKYSVKALFKRRSQATHFSCSDSNLRIIYISSVSCFMTETTVTVGSFFSIQSLYEQSAFCTAPTGPLSFYENKQRVLDCRHFLCSFIVLSLVLSLSLFPPRLQPGKPAKWVELQSGSVSGRFRFEVGKAKSQSQANLSCQEDSEGQKGWEISICSTNPFPSVIAYSSPPPTPFLLLGGE